MAMPPTSGDKEDNMMDQPLPQDNATPFSPPTSPRDDQPMNRDEEIAEIPLSDTHQVTDSNIEASEIYEEGLSGAAEASEPNAGNTVVDYDPEADQRKQDSV